MSANTGRAPNDASAAAPGKISTPLGMRLAVPVALPRALRAGHRRHRLLRRLANFITIIAAAIAILLAAAAAVMLGVS